MLIREANKQLSDLTFEILEGRESKFLLVVSDDDDMSKRVRDILDQEIVLARKKIAVISITKATDNLLQEFYSQSRLETPDAIALWGLQRLNSPVADSVLRQLNFHRDPLA